MQRGATNIELIVKVIKKRIFLNIKSVESVDEIRTLIQNMTNLNIDKEAIFLEDDGKTPSTQHLNDAQKSGSLEITLSRLDIIDTLSEIQKIQKEPLKRAFNVESKDPNGMKDKFQLYLMIEELIPHSMFHILSSGLVKDIPTIYLCLRDPNSIIRNHLDLYQ
ncbi:hypothetical protein Glove_428g65 [Diversispora epigaea]|uniref:Ubiquitin-like domain-containing protein n=1 Tax=Diversispora epigaea TaxID=1348612 RepID=A0A397GXQ4_9GLOM|nr:hypothetical protein Glove_428g65 [Diversispora epigaea]